MRQNVRAAQLVAASAGSVFPAAVMLHSPAAAAGCGVWAGTPAVNSPYDRVYGYGGRSGCATPKQIMVELKWDKPWYPDPVLDFSSGTFTNVTLYVDRACLAGTHDYYVYVSGQAGSASSDPRKTVTGLNC